MKNHAKYTFSLIDPRQGQEEVNEKIFTSSQVYGVEVTIAYYAQKCYFNLDPQHSGQDATVAAIEVSLDTELPKEESTLVTIRPDLDSVGAMAIFTMRADGTEITPEIRSRVELVAASDKFARGAWPGPRPLPSRESLFESELDGDLAAIGAAVADFKLSLEQRVALMIDWLSEGTEPHDYRERVIAEKLNMIEAIEKQSIKIKTTNDIAVVISSHRAGTSLGYLLRPVVLAVNPEFRFAGGEPHLKYTICVYEVGKYIDLPAVTKELSRLEPGWGGSPSICGSPQGVASQLGIEEILAAMKKHLF